MQKPCKTCSARGFTCTYDKPRKKRGPAGKRITEIKRLQSQGSGQSSDDLRDPTHHPEPPTVVSPSYNDARLDRAHSADGLPGGNASTRSVPQSFGQPVEREMDRMS
ncbi:hypothetical protein LTS18_004074, partial [Coniosporium uncinatum]